MRGQGKNMTGLDVMPLPAKRHSLNGVMPRIFKSAVYVPAISQKKKKFIVAAVIILTVTALTGPGSFWVMAVRAEQKKAQAQPVVFAADEPALPTSVPASPVIAIGTIAVGAVSLLLWIIKWLFGKVDEVGLLKSEIVAMRAAVEALRVELARHGISPT